MVETLHDEGKNEKNKKLSLFYSLHMKRNSSIFKMKSIFEIFFWTFFLSIFYKPEYFMNF